MNSKKETGSRKTRGREKKQRRDNAKKARRIADKLFPGEKWENVFINLETSDLSRHEIIDALYSARNSITHKNMHGKIIKGYAEKNKFHGGRIILKLKGHKNLIYLNVDDLKSPS